MAAESPIQVGIAGLGRSGWQIHANLLKGLPDYYQVAAVADAEASRRQEAEDVFDCDSYEEFGGLLGNDRVELVVISLPSFLHADLTVRSLQAGRHVVCEKPMADSLPAAQRMVTAAQESDPVLSIFQQRRYNPDFRKVQEILASGILGRIVQIRMTENKFGRRWDWQTLKQYGGGTLNNTGPHYLDQALQLFGPAEPEVFCNLEKTVSLGDADDHLKLVFKADGQATMDIEISSACAFPGESWNIMGTQGGLWGNRGELRWKYFDPQDLPPRELDTRPTPDRSYNRDEIPWREDSWQQDKSHNQAYAQYYLDLYQTIRHGAPLVITPESVYRVIQLQEKCHELSPV